MTQVTPLTPGLLGNLSRPGVVPAFIDGQRIDVDRSFEVDDPASGATVALVANCGIADATAAVDAASQAASPWAAMSPMKRADVLAVVEHQQELAVSQVLGELCDLRRPIPTTDAEGTSCRRRHERRIGQVTERHEPDAVWIHPGQFTRQT